MNNVIWDDLGFFVKSLKGLPASESLMLSEKSYCVSTRTESENWVYCPEGISSVESVREAVRFFREREEVFMWPVYSVGREVLGDAGLIYAGDLTAMMFEPESVRREGRSTELMFERVREDNAGEWAMTAWRGFGGSEEDMPESYGRFVSALSEAKERVGLYLAKCGGESVGVFSVTNEAEMMGVYYFAVVPEFRRRGIAGAMMDEICGLSGGKRIVLQSTPMGKKFYVNYGFRELFKIPVYSTERDIF